MPSFALPPPLPRPQARAIRCLQERKWRMRHQAFLLQGHKSVQALLASSYTLRTMVATPTYWQTHPLVGRKEVRCYTAAPSLLARLGTFQSNDDVLAVAAIPPCTFPPLTPVSRILVLDGIQDPGNLGTIIRTAAWYGLEGIVASPTTVDCYNPKVLQASMGAFLHLPVCHTPLLPFLAQSTLPVVGATLTGTPLSEAPLPAAGLLIIGNESHGIGSSLYPYLQAEVTLPCYGPVASLNAAVAAAILMHQWHPHA